MSVVPWLFASDLRGFTPADALPTLPVINPKLAADLAIMAPGYTDREVLKNNAAGF